MSGAAPGDVAEVFRTLTARQLRYALIRSRPGRWQLGGSDIDVVVDPADRAETGRVLADLGLLAVRKGPRGTGTLYRRITPAGLLTLHVQTTIHYVGRDVVHLEPLARLILDSAALHDGVLYADPALDRLVVMGKIRYEGAALSPKYAEILGPELAGLEPGALARKLDRAMEELGLAERRERRRDGGRPARLARALARAARAVVSNGHICVQGVDGTGKSTLVAGLGEALGGRVAVQYMGDRRWETRLAARVLGDSPAGSGRAGLRARLLSVTARYLEMWYRFLRASARSGIVVFDRYPTESFLRMEGARRAVYRLLFLRLFPQPRHLFYLTCRPSTSASRKEDLREEEASSALRERKGQLDAFYGHRSGVTVLDTDQLDERAALRTVLALLPPELAARL